MSLSRLSKFICSSKVMLASLELAQRDLLNISAAVFARQKRQSKDKKVVQKGGVITVGMARQAIDQRVEQEAQKVARKAARDYKLSLSQSSPKLPPASQNHPKLPIDPRLLTTPAPASTS